MTNELKKGQDYINDNKDLINENREQIARAIHKAYVEEQSKIKKTKDLSMKEWDELLEHLKESNRQQADNIKIKLNAINCDIREIKDGEVKIIAFTDEEIEIMAKMEHERWNIERLVDGWKYGEKKDVEKKISPYILQWEQLSDEVKEWDRQTVRKIPQFLAKVGLEVYARKSEKNDIRIILYDYMYKIERVRIIGRTQLAEAVKIIEPMVNEIKARPNELGLLWKLITEVYRDIEYWKGMIGIYENSIPESLKRTRLMNEQYAFALNRRNQKDDREKAIKILKDIISLGGTNKLDISETYGLIGRVYKDLYKEKRKQTLDKRENKFNLEEAIKYYKLGFETNTKNFYVGINAVTLMLLDGKENTAEYTYFLEQILNELGAKKGLNSDEYWVVATILEAYALSQKWEFTKKALERIEVMKRQHWMVETTIRNLQEIENAFRESKIGVSQLTRIITRMCEIKGN